MKAHIHALPACCGVSVIGSFGLGSDIRTLTTRGYDKSGTGYYVSTFNELQRKAYEGMCKTYTLVYQTEPKRNKFSDRQVFVAIFKEKE